MLLEEATLYGIVGAATGTIVGAGLANYLWHIGVIL